MGVVSSVRWVAVSQSARVASQLISVAVLSRILLPEAYGLMAMAMTVTNLVFLFRDAGTTAALIQRKELTPSLQSTVYWTNVGLGVLLAMILAALAIPIAKLFGQAQLSPMIVVLALVFPIASLGLVHQALMERALQFRTLARIEVVGAVGGLAVAISLALYGAGVWSLVFQMVVSALLISVQLVWASDWKPKRIFRRSDLRELLGFGGNLSLFRAVVYLHQNADSVIIGKLLGSAALGIYSMALKIMLFPLQNLTTVVSRVLFPKLSQSQESPEIMGGMYLRAVSAICMLTAPMMAGVFILREEFVAIMFGPSWSEVADVLKWLAAVGFATSVASTTGDVFMSLGRTRLLLGFGIFGAVLQLSAYIIGVRWGIEGVAAGSLVASVINFFPSFYYAALLSKIPLANAAMTLVRPVLASAAMILFLGGMQPVFHALPLPLILIFALQVVTGALIYAFTLLVILRQDISDMRALVKFS
jgi:O-antigen/teichoic acid export membrane protein